MFTGIITQIGRFKKQAGSVLTFEVSKPFIDKIRNGTSVSVNGACLTVQDHSSTTSFTVEAVSETFEKTMLSELTPGEAVNLELPLTSEDMISGHFLQGHVDTTGTVKKIEQHKNSWIISIGIQSDIRPYIVNKGSIAINGVSLTVLALTDNLVRVAIIPYTWKNTMFNQLKQGDNVNIEVDIIAKYVKNFLTNYEKK